MLLSKNLTTWAAISAVLSTLPSAYGNNVRPKGLTIADYGSIVFTETENEFGLVSNDQSIVENAENLWNTATDLEWERAEAVEMSFENDRKEVKDSPLMSKRANPNFPYVVCMSDSEKSGYKIRTLVESHFGGDNITNMHNSKDKACFMAYVPASVARSAPETMKVQPLLSEMKIASGTIDMIKSSQISKIKAMICPVEGGSVKLAEQLSSSMMSSIINDTDDDAGMDSLSKERFLQEGTSRSKEWKSILSEGIDSADKCEEMFKNIYTSSGYKGESFVVGMSENGNEKSAPMKFSPACVLSLVTRLATRKEVCMIEGMQEIELRNAPSQWILQSGVVDERPWFDAGVDGTGQVVAVSDTGIDVNNCYFYDSNGIVKDGSVQESERKLIQYEPYANNYDEGGHGTHVAGTVAGRRTDNGRTDVTGSGDGMAREAKLSMYDIGNDAGGLSIPSNVEDLFTPGQEAGAFIHSASWGANSNYYDYNAREFDAWTVDNPNFLTMVAAGNSGKQGFFNFDVPGSVGTPATAKNIISVGATESYGEELTSYSMEGYEYLAYFSSRGPTADNRMKPDLVAPGYNIISAKSQNQQYSSYACDDSDGLQYMAGTSMATPAVSGMMALVRQYFIDGMYPSGTATASDSFTPTASLMKAVVMNGAQYLQGVNNKPARGSITSVAPYDNNQGFGRLSLMDSLYLEGSNDLNLFVENDATLADGDSETYSVSVPEGCSSDMISVTLAWTDPTAYSYCRSCLMNDLDLLMYVNKSQIYPNGLDEADYVNNVERIQSEVSSGDDIVIEVTATNLVSRNTDYSLVITGCFEMS